MTKGRIIMRINEPTPDASQTLELTVYYDVGDKFKIQFNLGITASLVFLKKRGKSFDFRIREGEILL